VCPQGEDCGVENVNFNVELAPYSAKDQTTSSTGAVTVSILIIAAVAVILVIIYYKKRMKVMKKDLKNRSVYYSDGGSVDSSRTHDLIIRDFDPLNVGNEAINNLNTQNMTINNHSNNDPNLLNNVRVTLDSQRYPIITSENQTNAAPSNVAVKNVNLENVKLNALASCDDHDVDGAAGTSNCNTIIETNNFDVNVFHNDFKSNINSRYQNKAAKADLEVMIRNNLKEEKEGNCKRHQNNEDTSDDEDDNSLAKLKVNLSNTDKTSSA